MKKESKWMPYIIAAGALAVFIALFSACASGAKGPPPTYVISTKPVAEGFLNGKRAVIFNIETAARGKAILMERRGSGGIFSLIGGGARLIRLGVFNNSAKKFDRANEADLREAMNALSDVLAMAWQRAYNAETVRATYDFGRSKPNIAFFNRPNAALKKEIADICAANNADFAVTVMQQIQHGYMDEQSISIAGKVMAMTHIAAQICVYDKAGNVVILASAKLPNVLAGVNAGWNLRPNDGDAYAELYINGFGNILTTILAFDSSASFTSIEQLMEGVSVQLATTEDAEEGEDEDDD